jgi:hypothetical protein
MKNYIIVFLIVCLLVSLSFHYKNFKISNNAVLHEFPISMLSKNPNIEYPVYLFLFFSKSNCRDCLDTFAFLNRLGPPFIVVGVAPDEELANEAELRNQTGVTFKILGLNKYKKYAPLYGPSLLGVSGKGRILFLIPGIPGQAQCLKDFQDAFYLKAYRVLMI